jgi:hypothetical protein
MAVAAQGKRVRDWAKLDAAHRRRGELITVFFDPTCTAMRKPRKTQRRGRPFVYSAACIEALLTVKLLLRLSLRAAEGFGLGMARLVHAKWEVPDYTTLSRRERTLDVSLGSKLDEGRRHVLIVDSTGLKVFGEGEWKVRMHGTDGKRRTWRKVHILVDRESGQVIAVQTTDGSAGDAPVLPGLLPEKLEGDFVLGDGAYHTKDLHRLVHARGGQLLSPPPVNAQRWRPYHHRREEPAFTFRNSQLTPLKRLGRTAWKVKTGLSQRSFVECTNHRLKAITGGHLAARTLDRQEVEVRLRCKVLNQLAVRGKGLVA